jgi:hypothetical protein
VLPDPTMEYSAELCDIVIENHDSIETFQDRLWTLARFGGLLK